MKRGIVWAVLLSLLGIGGIWSGLSSVGAATFNSSNFSINGNLGDSAAGGQNSTSYQLTSTAGESISGAASSKSYKMGQGYVPTLENSIQVVTQPSGLSAYWPLDDAAPNGPAIDESSNLNDGTYEASTVSVPGKVGTAWSDFNTTQHVTIPDSPSLPSGDKMTISGWIKKNNNTERAIVTKWQYSLTAGSWAFQLSPGGTELRAYLKAPGSDDGSNWVDSTNASLSNGVWYHVAMVYDGSLANNQRVKMFVNGTQLTTATTGTVPTTLTNSTHDVVIGMFPGLGRGWSGAIDELKLYDRALTTQELKADYDAGNAGIPAGLSVGSVTPGTSQTAEFDSIVQTSAGGYSLAINQNNNLTSGGNTIPAVAGSIASPVTWSEGSTKGLGFTLYGTNATAIPGTWASGAAYAALPGSATSFYTRSNYTGGTKDILNMRLRLDTTTAQTSGDYTNRMTITGTMIP